MIRRHHDRHRIIACCPLCPTWAARHPEQEAALRRAAEVVHKTLIDFILDSAGLAAEQTLLDQRLFMVSGSQCRALLGLLERPKQANDGLADLFARKAPWDAK